MSTSLRAHTIKNGHSRLWGYERVIPTSLLATTAYTLGHMLCSNSGSGALT